MQSENIIVSETQRPFWHLIIAALFFTCAFFLIIKFIYHFRWNNEHIRSFAEGGIPTIVILIAVGLNFCTQKRVYINLKESKFKPSLEIGLIKLGKWKTIQNYEYISVFYNPTKSESEQFEVNLWYDTNKHFELYTRNNFKDAMLVGYNISEQLDIDLLDATIRGDNKWVDKEELLKKTNEVI